MTPDRRAARFSQHQASYAHCSTDTLGVQLKGAEHVNLTALAKQHFSIDFLRAQATGLNHSLNMMRGLESISDYMPSELTKCVVHYCGRELIKDLWGIGAPAVKRFIDSQGRVNLQDVLKAGNYGEITDDIDHNLEVGRVFLSELLRGIYDSWGEKMIAKGSVDPNVDRLPLLFVIYTLNSVLTNKGKWDRPSTLEATFTSPTGEFFGWARHRPDLTREEMDEIIENTVEDNLVYASQMGQKSTAREDTALIADLAGDLMFVLDEETRTIVLNPKYSDTMKAIEDELVETFPDQTNLRLQCSAKFVRSDVFPEGSMLHDLLRFKFKVYAEIYHETQRIKAAV